jgi:hypothetical protein
MTAHPQWINLATCFQKVTHGGPELVPVWATAEELSVLEGEDREQPVSFQTMMWSGSGDPRVRMLVDGRRQELGKRVPTTLPLAQICGSRLALEKMGELGRSIPDALLDLWSWIRTDRIALALGRGPIPKVRTQVCRCVTQDLGMLKRTGVLRPTACKAAVPLLNVFKVRKGTTDAARLIVDCRPVNDILPSPGNMGLPTIRAVMDCVLGYNYIAEADAQSYFYQFPLTGGAEDAFRVAVGAQRGAFSVMAMGVLPMGFSYAPAIAQHTSNFLIAVIQGRAQVKALRGRMLVWVDNFIIVGETAADVRGIAAVAEQVFDIVQLRLKAAFGDPVRHMEVLGIQFDLEDHSASVTRTMRGRLETMEGAAPTTSLRDLAQVVGTVLWANWTVAREPLCTWVHVLGHIRDMGRAGHRATWDSEWRVPPLVHQELVAIAGRIRRARYGVCLGAGGGTHPLHTWYADASSTGSGLVQQTFSRYEVWEGGAWPSPIYLGELGTLIVALLQRPQGYSVSDNRAALQAVVRGHSGSEKGNLLLRILVRNMLSTEQLQVAWVPTAYNPADAPSRGVTFRELGPTPEPLRPVTAGWRCAHSAGRT